MESEKEKEKKTPFRKREWIKEQGKNVTILTLSSEGVSQKNDIPEFLLHLPRTARRNRNLSDSSG